MPGKSPSNCSDLHRLDKEGGRRSASSRLGAKKGRQELYRMINGAGHDSRGVQYVVRNIFGAPRTIAEKQERRNDDNDEVDGHRDCRTRSAPSSSHLNKTAVSCVYHVQREREREREHARG